MELGEVNFKPIAFVRSTNKMIIALDYDETFTIEPDMWMDFLRMAQAWDFQVIIATGRKGWTPDIERQRHNLEKFDDIVFCGDEYKSSACKGAGYEVNVWIDDMPQMISPSLLIGSNNEL